MKVVIAILIVIVVLIIVVAIWAIIEYNGLVKARNMVQEAWRQIDVELHRRYDLIPNLVETVKGYAKQESSTLAAVTQAREVAQASGADKAQQAAQEGQLTSALGHLFAVAESYPELKSNQNFLQLQTELTNTEDRIASGRRYYNAIVRNFNTKLESFPASIIANTLHLTRADYFEVDDPAMRATPQVNFDGQAPGGPVIAP